MREKLDEFQIASLLQIYWRNYYLKGSIIYKWIFKVKMNHLLMTPWAKVRSGTGYKVHGFQPCNFAFKFIFLACISTSISLRVTIPLGKFPCDISIILRFIIPLGKFPCDILSIKPSNSKPCYQATQGVTNKWNLLNAWVTFYDWYYLKETVSLVNSNLLHQVTHSFKHI